MEGYNKQSIDSQWIRLLSTGRFFWIQPLYPDTLPEKLPYRPMTRRRQKPCGSTTHEKVAMRRLTGLVFLAVIVASAPTVVPDSTKPPIKTSNRIEVLEDQHGYFPCMDCHEDIETNTTPRFLVEEHEIPLEWEDEDGNTRFVPFGERVSFAQLLGKTAGRSIRTTNLARVGTRINAAAYMEENDFALEDSVYVLTHGGANLWCLDCHSPTDRNQLRKLTGDLLSFNESQMLCGQCHGPILRDWEHGAHGRTNGYWNLDMDTENITTRLLCVECHIPHAPAFASRWPKQGPISRIDNISNPAPGGHHAPAPGARDDLGPHEWEKVEKADVKKGDHP